MDSPTHPVPIVGIGASAGGVEALEGFFRGLPANPGLGFVIVTHLSPDRESLLHEVVGRYTQMKVAVAAEGLVIGENRVYVAPPGAVLGLREGRLTLRESGPGPRYRKPIDVFFGSLATDRRDYAAGVVLSGGDGDGTLGIKAIKGAGGITFAQIGDAYGPRHPSMPSSAIATGVVDFALPVEEMGARLVEFARGLRVLDGIAEGGIAEGPTPSSPDDWDAARADICTILQGQVGHDFSGYKPRTFIRRVQRRMQIMGLATNEAYVARLRADPTEAQALFRDLLINVTAFFRDTEAFEELEREVVPKLFDGRGADAVVRVWVPGCATGEEVYSLAILMQEHMATLAAPPRVQIFATDIDDIALGVARAARYPAALLTEVSAKRLERFFVEDEGAHVVRKEVRELCIFSPHSVIRDPPFSRIDLISCRN